MKGIKTILFFLLLVGNFSLILSNNTAEYQKAQEQLESREEVYFKFYANSVEDVLKLSDVISIDKAVGNEIYAYANAKEFDAFLKHNLYYEAPTPEALLGPKPVMSDYSPKPDWTKYPTFDGYKNIMAQFETTYPEFVKVEEIGKSINGKELLVAKVSDNVELEECEPEWFLVGATHGNETMGCMICLRLIEWLCESYTRDSRAHRILDSIEMYILPFTNPDGTYRSATNIQNAVRYNAANVDLNRNWKRVPGTAEPSQTPTQETIVVRDWEFTRHIVMNIDYHAGTETAIYPYSGISRRTVDNTWWKYVTRIYADLAQENGPSGYYDNCDNGICHGYSELGYVAQGTTKDWFYYYMHARGISNELTSRKLVYESDLEMYWEANLDATLAYIQEVLNGIRGTVVDEVTKVGLPAKVWVENHDTNQDSSFMYADSGGGHGNYYRPIYQGTYDVTYSCPGCESKTIEDISVTNGEATIVNVELDCGSTFVDAPQEIKKPDMLILPFKHGIKIYFKDLMHFGRAAIYDVNGKLIKTLSIEPGKKSILWDGISDNSGKASSGCYILQVKTGNKAFSQSFVLAN